jgi:electron transfer flavoprotein beta subunit
MMHVIVCIKSVVKWDSGEQVGSGGGLVRTAENCELNPYDRPAIEAGLRVCEERGGAVTALSMGPEASRDALFEALAMGAGRAVLACDPALAGSDTLATSHALAAAVKKLEPFDLVLFGARTADSDTGQVGPQTAAFLGLPLVTWCTSIEAKDEGLSVERKADGFHEVYELDTPAALTVHPGALMPRDVPLGGIEAAYAGGEIELFSCAELGIEPEETGEGGSPTRVLSMNKVTKERRCELVTGTVDEQADELVRRLMEKGLIG